MNRRANQALASALLNYTENVDITVDDPKAYKEVWTVKQSMHYLPDTDLIEHTCEDNNKFPEQIGAAPP